MNKWYEREIPVHHETQRHRVVQNGWEAQHYLADVSNKEHRRSGKHPGHKKSA